MSKDRETLFREWVEYTSEAKNLRTELSNVDSKRTEVQQQLAKSLLPPDAKPGEQFNIWIAGCLVSVEVSDIPPTPMGSDVSPARQPHYVYIRCQTK